jgi:DUF4097 and DUF4098 domain-containing protein YvlB
MPGLMLAAVAIHVAVSAGPLAAQTAERARAPQTDQTVTVARGARLDVENFAGEVAIKAWDRDAVRVQAHHASRTRVSVKSDGGRLVVSASGAQGPASSVDYEISVPRWMPVKVDGTYAFIAIEGTTSEVTAETVRGDVAIKGGGTFVSAKSIEGEVTIEGTRGRITASSVNEGITIAGTSGDITADTVNGPISMASVESENVTVESLNGSVRYEGNAAPRGKYRFTTHNGSILVAVPESSSAAFSVRTYNGAVHTNLTLSGSGDPRRGRRVVYTLGGGAADFELESFGGAIHLRRPGTLPPPRNRDKGKTEKAPIRPTP